MDGIFAGTPPLEAMRYLIHEAATVRSHEPKGSKVLMINDVARAFFEAPAVRNVCVEILAEDMTEEDRRHDKVGHLQMSMYGTRDAASNWEQEYSEFLELAGFARGKSVTCSFHHASKDMCLVVHGDDFTAT